MNKREPNSYFDFDRVHADFGVTSILRNEGKDTQTILQNWELFRELSCEHVSAGWAKNSVCFLP